MSVQGEYSRALESLLADVRPLEDPSAAHWAAGLEAARPGRASDLTTAAKHCLEVLEAIEAKREAISASETGPDVDALRRPLLHLRAHCCAILGIPDSIAD